MRGKAGFAGAGEKLAPFALPTGPAFPAASFPDYLLNSLKNHPILSSFYLDLIRGPHFPVRGIPPFCGQAAAAPCEALCRDKRAEAVDKALKGGGLAAFRCDAGLINFAVRSASDQGPPFCLLAGGVRENSSPLLQSPPLPLSGSHSSWADFVEKLDHSASLSLSEVKSMAKEIQSLLQTLTDKSIYDLALEKATRQLGAMAEVSAEIDRVETVEEVAVQLCEALVVIFDLPRIALVLADGAGRNFSVLASLGLPQGSQRIDAGRCADYLKRHTGKAMTLPAEEAAALFPDLPPERITLIPLVSGGPSCGTLALFNIKPEARDLLAMEILAGRAAGKVMRIREGEERRQDASISSRMLAMISSLSLMESREDLCRKIVEMSAELLVAGRGSLMLLDEAGENLHIEACIGMHPPLARTIRIKVGSGISGKVVKNGSPLVINDIEKDSRVGIPNRPRFQTKSLISVPLLSRGRPFGVLNLSDKKDGGLFDEGDLEILAAFACHASLMIERAVSVERAKLLEELAITDPLTGLYNRRFLEGRLEEELNRSSRQGLQFTLMFIDLDNFKIYNDLCGHLGGDHALRRVAQLLKISAREMDIVIRYGGEEFCIILPGTSKKEAALVAERVRRAIEKDPFPRESELPLGTLTVSIGLASFPEDGHTARRIINAADLALYQAKDQGRNRLVVFDSSHHSPLDYPDPIPLQS
jgi:diguanylate cyclase (GGDEF)-like protein